MVGITSFQNSQVAQALYGSQKNINSSTAKIASGNKFSRAADNVAALAVATKMGTELSGLRAQQQNAAFSSSMLQIADGALDKISNMLQRQQSLAMMAKNGSLTDAQRGQLNQEFQALTDEINRVVGSTNFNGVQLIGGNSNSDVELAQLDSTAQALAGASNNVSSANSSAAIEAFDSSTGGSLQGNSGAGQLQFVNDNGVALSDGEFANVNSSVVGKFDNFTITDVNYGVSATVKASINGVEFSGTAVDGATSVIVSDGSGTNIELALTNFDLTDDATTSISQAQLNSDFANTSIQRTNVVNGVNFSGTALEGVVGGAGGSALVRVDDGTVNIGNFEYVGSNGVNDNTLSVEINGETYTATGVSDSIADGDVIRFENGDGQALQIDFTGLNNNIGNIRLNESDRNNFVNALNQGFARAGGNFNSGVGTGVDDIELELGDASTDALFDGQQLDISTVGGADTALNILGSALDRVTQLRADIGAQQSRIDSASEQISSEIQNLEFARANLADTDIVEESSTLAAAMIKAKASIAVQAQSNRLSGTLLNLINGNS